MAVANQIVKVDIYTDGSCLGNPGNGGFAYIIFFGDISFYYSYGQLDTTNNRMELSALLYALKSISTIEIDPKLTYEINVYSDSKYVTDAVNKNWLFNWVRKGFLNVKNTDLWSQVYYLLSPLMLMNNVTVNFNWVKGHSGNENNERVDKMARQCCGMQGIVSNYEYRTYLIEQHGRNR